MSKAVANLTQLNETITFSAQDNGETINVKINELARGPAGADGPNEITTATTTDLTGYIFGDGSFIGGATTATADPDPSTLVLRDSLGEAEFEGLRVNPGGSPDGDFDVGGGVFNVDMQTLSASCSGTFTASDVQATTATVSGTLTADHIHGNLAGSVYAHVRAGENLAKGDPVYVSGSHGTGANLIAIVSKADASDPLKMPAVGVMDAAVTANANGHMVITGTISDINTATYSVNAELYVAEGGGFTATPPNAYAQPVARVERSNTNNGAVIVKVNGLSAISPTVSTLVRRDSSGVSDFNTINLGDLHTGGSPSAPYGSIGKNVLTGSSGVGISGNPDVALEAATHRLTLSSSGIALTSGTITTSQPLSLTQTWNAGAVTFKGIDVNITDTSSASGSLLMDLRVGGNPYFSIEKDGSTRLYRTYSSSTNFERLNFKYTGTAFQIGTEKGSAGGTARPLEFQTDGTTRMTIGATGNIGLGTTAPEYALHVNSTATSRFAVQSNGRVHIGGITNANFAYSVFNIAAEEPALDYGATINLEDTRAVAEGIGSRILMGSRYNATQFTGGVVFGAYKENSTVGNYSYSFTIGTRANGSSISEKMRITSAGNVGIGTTNPASKLTVTSGDAEVTDSTKGLILKSPDGTRYRITVANGGTLTVTAV